MSKGQMLQDPFLNALRKERVPVSIYLVNGIKLQGHIESFDQFVVLLRNSVSQMVYKHAISTVVPTRNVKLASGASGEEDEFTVAAEPYFLALKGSESDFVYNWKINGKSIDTPSRKTELTIRPASRGGYATIDVVFENLNTFYQHVSGKIKLTL